MLGNEEIRTHLLKRYKCFAELIAAKISERTSKVSGEYFACLLLLMSDGLSIHQIIGNDHLDTEMFIQQTAKYIEDFLQVIKNRSPEYLPLSHVEYNHRCRRFHLLEFLYYIALQSAKNFFEHSPQISRVLQEIVPYLHKS